MLHKILALVLACSLSSIKAHEVFFAPYEGPFPVSIESRFDGYVWHDFDSRPTHLAHTSFAFNGYVRYPDTNYLFKFGTFIEGWSRSVRRVGIDLQFGKYWEDTGALRIGLMYDGIGIGGDYWLVYKDRFKLLTTLEGGTLLPNDCDYYFYGHRFKPFIRWSNRLFVFSTLYLSFGIDHIHCSSEHSPFSFTQGFIGFGSTI